jgi:hypothetical protein
VQGSRTVAVLAACLVATFASSIEMAGADTLLPSSGVLLCERAALGQCNFRDPDTGFVFEWPHDWPVRRLKIMTETGPPARARQRDATRWISLEYVPDDPTQPEVPLFTVAVVKRTDWIAQSMHSRLAMTMSGVEVATGVRHVAVAWRQPVNPYPPETRDADIFEALMPTLEHISQIVRFPTRPTEQKSAGQ